MSKDKDIRFRGKPINSVGESWVQGYLAKDAGRYLICLNHNGATYEVDPDTIEMVRPQGDEPSISSMAVEAQELRSDNKVLTRSNEILVKDLIQRKAEVREADKRNEGLIAENKDHVTETHELHKDCTRLRRLLQLVDIDNQPCENPFDRHSVRLDKVEARVDKLETPEKRKVCRRGSDEFSCIGISCAVCKYFI